jgi:hypothetical protein
MHCFNAEVLKRFCYWWWPLWRRSIVLKQTRFYQTPLINIPDWIEYRNRNLANQCSILKLINIQTVISIVRFKSFKLMHYRVFKLWRISGSKRTKRPLKCSHNFILHFILYVQQSDICTTNPAMKKKFRTILTVSLFYLDPEVVYHTNDFTLNSSIKQPKRS